MKIYIILLALLVTGCKNTSHSNQSDHIKLHSTEFITEAYKDKDGIISDEEKQTITKKGCAPVYGEILYSSLKTLLDDLNIKPTDVFYDLGSGTGKVTIQAYLDYPFKKAVGIELSPTRFGHAIDAKNQLISKNAIDKNRTLEFKNENIIQADINDATVIFMCATCFPEDLMLLLTEKLSKLKPGLKVLTLKELINPTYYGFTKVKEYSLPMTWSSHSPVYLYELK